MKKIPESDQWKLDGICDKCRRDKYCSKPCSANVQLIRRHIAEMIPKGIRIMKEENTNESKA